MSYAKIKNSTPIKYPYSFVELHEENPSSEYDSRFSIDEWYAMTDLAVATNTKLVKVAQDKQPVFDSTSEYIIEKTVPALLDGVWTIGWDIFKKSKTEIESALL